MRSAGITNEIVKYITDNKIMSISVNRDFYYNNWLNEEFDYEIKLDCYTYTGRDSDKMITKKQYDTIMKTHNVTIIGALEDITKVAAVLIIKFAFNYPCQQFNINVKKKKGESGDECKNVLVYKPSNTKRQ